MGIGPVPATEKALRRTQLTLDEIDLIELNEAFAAQSLAVLRERDIAADDPRVNVNGGAIAIGHPLGRSGARLIGTLVHEFGHRPDAQYALATMCIGVGQRIPWCFRRYEDDVHERQRGVTSAKRSGQEVRQVYDPLTDTPTNYRREGAEAYPPSDYPPYKSTQLRHRKQPLIYLRIRLPRSPARSSRLRLI